MLAAVIEGTTLITRRPVSRLTRFTGCFFSIRYASGASVHTLPDPSTYLIVEVPEAGAPHCWLTGPRLKSVRSDLVAAMQVVGIRLRPGVAFLLTGVGAKAWVGKRVAMEAILGPCAVALATQIAGATDTDARFDRLETFLVARLANKEVDRRVCIALQLIQGSQGAMRVPEIAQRCDLSCRQLERLMQNWVGLSPKFLARVARFQAALGNASERPGSEWAYVAAEHDYADQAHLIHEFSGFTGASPTRFAPLTLASNLKADCD